MLNQQEIENIENLLVEFHDIFARHRFEIGMNEEFNVKLTTKDDSPAYSQRLPTPVNLKDDILIQLALFHKYGNTTVLKICQPYFLTEKAKWQTTPPGRS